MYVMSVIIPYWDFQLWISYSNIHVTVGFCTLGNSAVNMQVK